MKYPRTHHLPWTLTKTKDDKVLDSVDHLQDKTMVYLEKMDGECTFMSSTNFHARSEDSASQPWQSYIKGIWSGIKHRIAPHYHIYGENMFAIHSIEYERLGSYFYVFAVVDTRINQFLPWNSVTLVSHMVGLPHVPEICRTSGVKDIGIPRESRYGSECEGYVVRNLLGFDVPTFDQNVAKCVRENHVQTDEHWSKHWKQANICKEEEQKDAKTYLSDSDYHTLRGRKFSPGKRKRNPFSFV